MGESQTQAAVIVRQLITRVLIFRNSVDVPRSPVFPSPCFLDTRHAPVSRTIVDALHLRIVSSTEYVDTEEK